MQKRIPALEITLKSAGRFAILRAGYFMQAERNFQTDEKSAAF